MSTGTDIYVICSLGVGLDIYTVSGVSEKKKKKKKQQGELAKLFSKTHLTISQIMRHILLLCSRSGQHFFCCSSFRNPSLDLSDRLTLGLLTLLCAAGGRHLSMPRMLLRYNLISLTAEYPSIPHKNIILGLNSITAWGNGRPHHRELVVNDSN